IARQESAVELAELNRRPDFEFSFGRFINYGRSDGFGAMASVTVPFIYSGKYDAGTAEARARLAGAEADLRGWQDRVPREVAQAYTRVRTAALAHGLARGTHLPQAEQALRVTETAYQAGTADFLSLLDTVRNIEAIHIQHVEAEAELAIATADLERAVGGALPPPVAARRCGAALGLRSIAILLLLAAFAAAGYLARPALDHWRAASTPPPATGRSQCAMHPQIVSDQPGTCPICEMKLQPVDALHAGGSAA